MNGQYGNGYQQQAAFVQGQAGGFYPSDPVEAIRQRIAVLEASLACVDTQRAELDRLKRMLAIGQEHLQNGQQG